MFDTNHWLKDAGAVTSSAAGTVDGEAQIINLGEGLVKACVVIDVTAIETASNDELYKISLQGSAQSNFAGVTGELMALELGAAEVLDVDQDSTIGRYRMPFRNEQNGTVFSYIRSYTEVSGTISTGINYSAHLEKE